MNERIQRLRERSLNTRPSISAERAVLMTEFYRSREAQGLSAPMKRARAFAL
jgi:formate C-acetyltransferase